MYTDWEHFPKNKQLKHMYECIYYVCTNMAHTMHDTGMMAPYVYHRQFHKTYTNTLSAYQQLQRAESCDYEFK
jgi:hypothetical protein